MSIPRRLPLLLPALLLAACARTPRVPPLLPNTGNASYQPHDDPARRHWELSADMRASGATLARHPPPDYPPGLLAACPPLVVVDALLVVDATGAVTEVRFSAPDAVDPAFLAAVRAAAGGWRFVPLAFTRQRTLDDGSLVTKDAGTRPFSRGYVFRFSCEGGRTAVVGAAGKD